MTWVRLRLATGQAKLANRFGVEQSWGCPSLHDCIESVVLVRLLPYNSGKNNSLACSVVRGCRKRRIELNHRCGRLPDGGTHVCSFVHPTAFFRSTLARSVSSAERVSSLHMFTCARPTAYVSLCSRHPAYVCLCKPHGCICLLVQPTPFSRCAFLWEVSHFCRAYVCLCTAHLHMFVCASRSVHMFTCAADTLFVAQGFPTPFSRSACPNNTVVLGMVGALVPGFLRR